MELWVTDFGVSKAIESEAVTRTGDVVGTLRYMAPEQIVGDSEIRSDIYSLGVTLYELLAGRPAMDDTSIREALVARRPAPEPPRLRQLNPKDQLPWHACRRPTNCSLMRSIAWASMSKPKLQWTKPS
jgi:serine/threonine protein kinase